MSTLKIKKIPTGIVVHDYIDDSSEYPNLDEAHFGDVYAPDEQEQLRNYSADSTGLNLFLLANHHVNDPIPSFINTINNSFNIPVLDGAINKMNMYIERPDVVYSGLGFDPRSYSVDGKIHFPGYISSSTNPVLADAFSGAVKGIDGNYNKHILKIQLNPDDKICPLAYENEMVMPRNTTIKIIKSSKDDVDPDMMIHDAVVEPTDINNVERNEDFIKKLHKNFHDYIMEAPQFSVRVKNLVRGKTNG